MLGLFPYQRKGQQDFLGHCPEKKKEWWSVGLDELVTEGLPHHLFLQLRDTSLQLLVCDL